MALTRVTLCSLAAAALAIGAATAQAQNQNPQQPGPRTIGRNLDNPTGIAVHPATGHIFVAERRGIVRFFRAPNEQGQMRMQRKFEINGFPSDVYGKGPMYDIGPLGVAFLDEEHLVVGDGSRVDKDELILVYDIPEAAPETPAKADSAEYTLGPLGANEQGQAEGNYYGVAIAGGAIFATANGDDTKGWIVRSLLKDGEPGPLERFIATKEAVNVDAPVAITVNKEGQLVVGQMGEINVPGDSLLTIYDAKTGDLKHNWETGLHDITGLAYSPTTGKLYATDFAWMDTTKGALYELTIKEDSVETRKIADLDKPTAIAFEPNGNALVTIIGTAEEGARTRPGQLIRFRRADL